MSKRVLNRLAFCILVCVFVSSFSAVQAKELVRKFQIDVIAITTPLGTPTVTEQMSRDLIMKVNQGLKDSTDGRISVEFRRLLPGVTSTVPVRNTFEFQKISGIEPKSDTGFEKAILIGVIPKDISITFEGQAVLGGNYTLINRDWNLGALSTVTHELGHNFGLRHANAVICGIKSPIECEGMEYGDFSSVMGKYLLSFVADQPLARFSVSELYALNILQETETVVALDTGDYRIAPAFGSTIKGPRVLLIPIADSFAYSVEYRPAIGKEFLLAESKLDISNSNSYYPNIPSYGVQVRILSVGKTGYPDLIPKVNNLGSFQTGLLVDSFDTPQVQPVGRTFNLSDNSTLTIVSASLEAGALIKIIRPKDEKAPRIEDFAVKWAEASFNSPIVFGSYNTINDVRQIMRNSERNWVYPKVDIEFNVVEDRKIKSLELEVNGRIVDATITKQKEDKDYFRYLSDNEGDLNFRVIATDYSGKSATSEMRTLKSEYYKLPSYSPFITNFIRGDLDPRNSVRIEIPSLDRKYQLSQLSSGELVSEELDNGDVIFVVRDIARNQEFTAFLSSEDELGHTDGGQIIRHTPRVSKCTNTECFVGFDWQVNTGTWPKGVGEMSLEELVSGKWSTIKRVKAVATQNISRVTYQIGLTDVQEGTRTFRLAISATKKYKKYIGKPFNLTVKP